jgi:FtsH-binding integral membrane protein
MNQAEFQASTPYARFGSIAIDAPVDARRAFIRQTYIHLAAAIYAFVALEWLLFSVGFDVWMLNQFAALGRWSPLLLVIGFAVVSQIADSWARSNTAPSMQYAGLFLYVAAFSILCVPMLAIAQGLAININGFGNVRIIPAAGVTTLTMFGGLTAYAFLTRQDFSFLRGMLSVTMFAAIALIIVSLLFGLHLGVWFSALMIVAACGYILYDTSNILHHYRTEQYVAASLALFASVGLLFWYILQIVMSFSNRD